MAPRASFPRPILIAMLFLAADGLWVVLLLAKFGYRLLEDVADQPWLLATLLGLTAWALAAAASVVGLLGRSRAAWTAAAALMAASAALAALPLVLTLLARGSLPLHGFTGVLLSALASFLTPLLLLLAGRRAYLEQACACKGLHWPGSHPEGF